MTRDPDAPIEVNPATGRTVFVSTDIAITNRNANQPANGGASLFVDKREFLSVELTFRMFVKNGGATIEPPHPTQLLRFRTARGTSYVLRHTDKIDYCEFLFEAAEAWQSFIMNGRWHTGAYYPMQELSKKACKSRKYRVPIGTGVLIHAQFSDRKPGVNRQHIESLQSPTLEFSPSLMKIQSNKLRRLYVKYDGFCWYCDQHVKENEASIEHLVAVVNGGKNHFTNLVLAHKRCNSVAGTITVQKKEALRELARSGIDIKQAKKFIECTSPALQKTLEVQHVAR